MSLLSPKFQSVTIANMYYEEEFTEHYKYNTYLKYNHFTHNYINYNYTEICEQNYT